MRLMFLGTSAATPTPERGLSSIALVRGYELLLFDENERSDAIVSSLSINSIC